MSILGIKIPENCVSRVRDELLLMDEEVKRRRKERQQQALEQRQAEERMKKIEQDNKHLLANLFSNKPLLNQSLVLTQNQLLKQKLNPLQRTQATLPPQQRMQVPNHTLQHQQQQPTAHNINLLTLRRGQNQPRTSHNGWSSNTTTSTNNQVLCKTMPSPVSSRYNNFYSQSFRFPQHKTIAPHQNAAKVSSKDPLEEILDLTVGSPSPSSDTTSAAPDSGGLGIAMDAGLTNHTDFKDDFDLESLISQSAQQSSFLPNHSLLNNHPDVLDLFDFALPSHNHTQKSSPSSSTSSCSSSSSVSNNHVSHSLLSTQTFLTPPSSQSIYSPTSSSSLFANSPFSSQFLPPQTEPLALTNGNCGSGTLDVREALNSMLQAGPDRKSVIQYRPQN
ncbi:hypothetical protein WMY93_001632 [Mugilogobius chulae]|uniref:Uncharacterized protein n=1 Tax=Mugilogobius chulae TaxID=88201 RepID=A0AAW0PR98_9GOBI